MKIRYYIIAFIALLMCNTAVFAQERNQAVAEQLLRQPHALVFMLVHKYPQLSAIQFYFRQIDARLSVSRYLRANCFLQNRQRVAIITM